ncbi:hypothetical protein GY45DRAFT_306258 [Cubamyces sp. BRFM 1775]|nr:hypothetical protein GY45DRAFT_306258 [Cubamyces sp. BRFM 1775]
MVRIYIEKRLYTSTCKDNYKAALTPSTRDSACMGPPTCDAGNDHPRTAPNMKRLEILHDWTTLLRSKYKCSNARVGTNVTKSSWHLLRATQATDELEVYNDTSLRAGGCWWVQMRCRSWHAGPISIRLATALPRDGRRRAEVLHPTRKLYTCLKRRFTAVPNLTRCFWQERWFPVSNSLSCDATSQKPFQAPMINVRVTSIIFELSIDNVARLPAFRESEVAA